MMRVLMLSWEYPPHMVGGMGRHVADLTPELARLGSEIHIVTPRIGSGAEREQISERVTVHRVPVPDRRDYDYITFAREGNALLEIAAQQVGREVGGFDLIHAHDWLVAHAAIGLKYIWHRPLVTTFHATERGRQQGHIETQHAQQIDGIEWWLAYESWRIIACSHFMSGQVRDFFRVPPEKIDIVPNGVQPRPNPFADDRARLAFRRRYARDTQALGFYVGRMVFEKGLHVLLDAWPLVQASMPRAQLVLAGTGGYLEQLKIKARALGIASDVTFTGFIADGDRNGLYASADLAIFPSIYEPFGIVALEAMVASCPVVVADSGGLGEVVRLHETGITTYPNSPDSLEWGIVHTLRHPEWSATRAANALREVHELYSWGRVAELTTQVYERMWGEWQVSAWKDELPGDGMTG